MKAILGVFMARVQQYVKTVEVNKQQNQRNDNMNLIKTQKEVGRICHVNKDCPLDPKEICFTTMIKTDGSIVQRCDHYHIVYKTCNKQVSKMEIRIQIFGRVFSLCIGKETEWFEQIYLFVLSEEFFYNRKVDYSEIIFTSMHLKQLFCWHQYRKHKDYRKCIHCKKYKRIK